MKSKVSLLNQLDQKLGETSGLQDRASKGLEEQRCHVLVDP